MGCRLLTGRRRRISPVVLSADNSHIEFFTYRKTQLNETQCSIYVWICWRRTCRASVSPAIKLSALTPVLTRATNSGPCNRAIHETRSSGVCLAMADTVTTERRSVRDRHNCGRFGSPCGLDLDVELVRVPSLPHGGLGEARSTRFNPKSTVECIVGNIGQAVGETTRNRSNSPPVTPSLPRMDRQWPCLWFLEDGHC